MGATDVGYIPGRESCGLLGPDNLDKLSAPARYRAQRSSRVPVEPQQLVSVVILEASKWSEVEDLTISPPFLTIVMSNANVSRNMKYCEEDEMSPFKKKKKLLKSEQHLAAQCEFEWF